MSKKIKIKFCPNCGSRKVNMFSGGITGAWRCLKCNFTSPIFPEKEVDENELGKLDKKIKRKRRIK